MTQANSSARRLVASPGLHPALDEAEADGEDAPACGWFDSSWALRQGLAVSELPDSDGTVEALWFAELAAGGRSAPLQ